MLVMELTDRCSPFCRSVGVAMSTGQLYRARFAFQGSDKNTLSFVAGETFTVISQPDNNWLKVRSVSGEEGFAPISYLQRCPAETPAEVCNLGYDWVELQYFLRPEEPLLWSSIVLLSCIVLQPSHHCSGCVCVCVCV